MVLFGFLMASKAAHAEVTCTPECQEGKICIDSIQDNCDPLCETCKGICVEELPACDFLPNCPAGMQCAAFPNNRHFCVVKDQLLLNTRLAYTFFQPHDIKIGDLGNEVSGTPDDYIDIVTIGESTVNGDNVIILYGNGDGSFEKYILANNISTGQSTVAVADFDEDGLNDVAISTNTEHLRIYYRRSDGGWENPINYNCTGQNYCFAAHDQIAIDLNCDSLIDLAGVVPWTGGVVAVWINDGNRAFHYKGYLTGMGDFTQLQVLTLMEIIILT